MQEKKKENGCVMEVVQNTHTLSLSYSSRHSSLVQSSLSMLLIASFAKILSVVTVEAPCIRDAASCTESGTCSSR